MLVFASCFNLCVGRVTLPRFVIFQSLKMLTLREEYTINLQFADDNFSLLIDHDISFVPNDFGLVTNHSVSSGAICYMYIF